MEKLILDASIEDICRTEYYPILYQKISYRTDIYNLNTRHRDTFTIPRHATSCSRRSFSFVIADISNGVNSRVRSLSQVKFKLCFTNHYLSNSCSLFALYFFYCTTPEILFQIGNFYFLLFRYCITKMWHIFYILFSFHYTMKMF